MESEKNTISIEDMKKLEFEMLCLLHQYCEEYNLRYYLIGGTLIGAIRHKGFIPWDDDIDVVMPRFDYDKFVNGFNKWVSAKDSTELIDITQKKGYYLAYAKLIRTDTVLVENVSNGIPIGVYLDVFCMDNASDSYREAVAIYKKTSFWRFVLAKKNRKAGNVAWWKRIVHNSLRLLCTPIPRKTAVSHILEKVPNYSTPVMTKYVCNYMQPTYKLKEIFLGEWFEERILAEFEGKQFYIPGGYDPLLRQLYGDYMQLPPVEKQRSHHSYDAYWKNNPNENLEENG